MTLQIYLDEVKEVVDRYAATHFVLEANVEFDIRPGEQGYLIGSIHFSDHSVLHFREFLDVSEEKVDKVMYVYHYQNAENQLIFRYDNARHKPNLPFIEHKHLPGEIIQASSPVLADVLMEVSTLRGWMK